MDEDHEEHGGHEHLPTERKVTSTLMLALAITSGFAVFELVGSLFSGSLALLSDSGHMFTDALALALSLGAAIIATREPTEKQTFGYYRVEILVALVNGAFLFGVSAYILIEAYIRFQNPGDIDAPLMFMVALVGLVANIMTVSVLRKRSHENLNVKGAFLHVLGDLLSSIGVIVAAALIFLYDLKVADPIISAVIGIVIMYGAFGVIRQSLEILLEFAPSHVEVEDIRRELVKIKGVIDIHDIHMWTIASGIYAMSGHLVVEDRQISACSCVLQECDEVLRHRFKFSHTTLQLEATSCPIDSCYFRRPNDGTDGRNEDDHAESD